MLRDQDAQIVHVGDRHQQIYEWPGAINAMEQTSDCEDPREEDADRRSLIVRAPRDGCLEDEEPEPRQPIRKAAAGKPKPCSRGPVGTAAHAGSSTGEPWSHEACNGRETGAAASGTVARGASARSGAAKARLLKPHRATL